MGLIGNIRQRIINRFTKPKPAPKTYSRIDLGSTGTSVGAGGAQSSAPKTTTTYGGGSSGGSITVPKRTTSGGGGGSSYGGGGETTISQSSGGQSTLAAPTPAAVTGQQRLQAEKTREYYSGTGLSPQQQARQDLNIAISKAPKQSTASKDVYYYNPYQEITEVKPSQIKNYVGEK